MRFLTTHEVERLGHEPKLIYEDQVHAFRHAATRAEVPHGSHAYEVVILMIDMDAGAYTPAKVGDRFPR